MYYIPNVRDGQEIYDPRINTAISKYVVNDLDLDDDAVLLTINQPCVMIGRFQNAYAEVDQQYLEEEDIILMRRLSGGGAVYHDYGNIMLMVKGDNHDHQASASRYGEYAKPILDALRALGMDAEASGRNDLVISGHKFSGTSFYSTPSYYMFGATIAFDLNKERAERVLKPNQRKLKSHAVKSTKGRIANVRDYLPEQYKDWNTRVFRDYLAMRMLGVTSLDEAELYELTAEDWAAIDEIVAKRFNNEKWNWGKRSDFSYRNSARFPQGTFDFQAEVLAGEIHNAKIYGDFFAKKDPKELAAKLNSVPYQPSAVRQRLKNIDLEDYISGWNVDELITLIFSKEE